MPFKACSEGRFELHVPAGCCHVGPAWDVICAGALADAGSLCRPQPRCHLASASAPGGRLALLIKNYNLHENDKAKREETDRVCPQPNPFCLSTFDLNSSGNTSSTVQGNIEKVSEGDVRHGLWCLYKCSGGGA